jgi:hypothetical protein
VARILCRCGKSFDAHGRVHWKPRREIETDRPCPKCGRKDDAWAVLSDEVCVTFPLVAPKRANL